MTAATLLRRPSLGRAALETDRLGGYDRVSTALELVERPDLSDPEKRQVAAAAAWAERRDASARTGDNRSALPWLAALGVAAALALALVPSPADGTGGTNRQSEAIEREAQRLEAEAADLPEEVRRQLEDTATRLRESADIDEALTRLGEARASRRPDRPGRTGEADRPGRYGASVAAAAAGRRGTAADQLLDLASRANELSPPSARPQRTSWLRAEDFKGSMASWQRRWKGLPPTCSEAVPGRAVSERGCRRLDRVTSEAAAAEAEAQARSAVRDAQERLDRQRAGRATAREEGVRARARVRARAGPGPGSGPGSGRRSGTRPGQGQGQGRAGSGSGAGGGGGGQGAGGSGPRNPQSRQRQRECPGWHRGPRPGPGARPGERLRPGRFRARRRVRVRLEGLEPGELRGRVEGRASGTCRWLPTPSGLPSRRGARGTRPADRPPGAAGSGADVFHRVGARRMSGSPMTPRFAGTLDGIRKRSARSSSVRTIWSPRSSSPCSAKVTCCWRACPGWGRPGC